MKLYKLLFKVSLMLCLTCLSTEIMAQDLYLEEPLSTGIYNSSGNIIARDNCLIEDEVIVLLTAPDTIRLTPGFHAKSGSKFKAMIGDFGQVSKDTDDDGDELLDWRELLDFGNFSQNRNQDYDGDGVSNYVEYKLQTNPADMSEEPATGLHYGYDILGRIESAIQLNEMSNNNYEIQFAYDSKGNRISRIVHTVQP